SPGVSYAYISRIEAGARRPSVKALRMLARKLGVTSGYLETGSDLADAEARELRLADLELRLRLDREVDAGELQSILDDATEHADLRSEEHTSELQSRVDLVCRLLLAKKNTAGT